MGESDGLGRDLLALRRHLWFPILVLAIALGAAAGIGLVATGDGEASFRARVTFSALPPLFGPPALPTAADLARFSTSPEVLERTSEGLAEQGVQLPAGELGPMMSTRVLPDEDTVEFVVKDAGGRSLAIARAWETALSAMAQERASDLERQAVADYGVQLQLAARLLEEKRQAAVGQPADSPAQAELAAAQENYEIASRLQQSYEVVAQMLRVDVTTERAPHVKGGGSLDWAGRLGAAAAFGIVVGVLGALGLEALARRRPAVATLPEGGQAEPPPSSSP